MHHEMCRRKKSKFHCQAKEKRLPAWGIAGAGGYNPACIGVSFMRHLDLFFPQKLWSQLNEITTVGEFKTIVFFLKGG